MKKLTRKRVAAAGIIAGAVVASAGMTGCITVNRNESVYGPPEQMELDVDENMVEAVYGPPEWFEAGDNQLEDVYGPPEDFQ